MLMLIYMMTYLPYLQLKQINETLLNNIECI